MAEQPQQLPLLLFPLPGEPAPREKLTSNIPHLARPSAERQGQRFGPRFQQLQSTLERHTLELQNAPGDNPELVLVIEIIGQVSEFVRAAQLVEGLEWLAESFESEIEPDDDFYDTEDNQKPLNGRLFLLGSNLTALNQIISLWQRYVKNPDVKLEHGLGKWKQVFQHLKDIRFWSFRDRVTQEIKQHWLNKLNEGSNTLRFEIEAWCYSSNEKNEQSVVDIERLVTNLGGTVLNRALLAEISYHGFLVEMPNAAVQQLISDSPPELALSERVMMFRLRGQGIADREDETNLQPSIEVPTELIAGEPIIALLDGYPLQNHPVLTGRLIIDDPDAWGAAYPANDRIHGTAMASLIALGDLEGSCIPLKKPIYVRPILKPDIQDFRTPRDELTPNNILLVDLIHRAVKRIFEGEGGSPPAAPTVKIINLSVGDPNLVFDSVLSPWAKLIDWLSFKYNVLFLVSAGNILPELALNLPRDSIATTQTDIRNNLAVHSLLSDSLGRRLIAPAESINALTVGAIHSDNTNVPPPPLTYDLFSDQGVSPVSRIGHGFSRSVKPDILLSGGKVLFKESLLQPPESTIVSCRSNSWAPGHLVAAPPNGGNDTKYTRGTSNATALASRSAAFAYEVIESLRAGDPSVIPKTHDAVLIKALLAHGAEWGGLESQVLNSHPNITKPNKQKEFVARNIGYGASDVDKALVCTQQRATVIGVGALKAEQSLVYRLPLPPGLRAQTIERKLTITLAWLSDINTKNAKYRSAKMWVNPPRKDLEVTGTDCQWQHVRRGTLQHEICKGNHALAFVDGDEIVFTVNCIADTGLKIENAIPFALCVTLEVAEGIPVQIYQEIRDRIQPRVAVVPR